MTLSRKTVPLLRLAALAALFGAGVAPLPASAQQIYQVNAAGTFQFITNDPANPVFDAAALAGSTFTASYLFDASVPDQRPPDQTGKYVFGPTPYGLTFTVYDKAHNPILTGTPDAGTVSDAFTHPNGPAFDSFSLVSGGPAAGTVDSLTASLTLIDPNGNYDSSLPISASFYDISHLPFEVPIFPGSSTYEIATAFDVIGDDIDGNEDDTTFKIDSLSLQPVPEAPTTVSLGLLLALGMGGLVVAARRQERGDQV